MDRFRSRYGRASVGQPCGGVAALGAWLGWQSLPLIILLSSAVGAIIGITMIVTKLQERSQPIPFGPYLAVAGWIAMLYGNQLIALYLNKTI